MLQLWLMPPPPPSVCLRGQPGSPAVRQLQTVGGYPCAPRLLGLSKCSALALSSYAPALQLAVTGRYGSGTGQPVLLQAPCLWDKLSFSCAASQMYSRDWFLFSYQLVLSSAFFLPFCATSPKK